MNDRAQRALARARRHIRDAQFAINTFREHRPAGTLAATDEIATALLNVDVLLKILQDTQQ